MKSIFNQYIKIVLLIALFTQIAFYIKSQTPGNFTYQAIFRDNGGSGLNNKTVSVRLSIINTANQVFYSETHRPTTNPFGMVNLIIGKGTLVSGVFSDIKWLENELSLKIEVDITGGTNYIVFAVTPFLSVPYAVQAKEALSSNLVAGNGISIENNTIGNTLPDKILTLKSSVNNQVSGTYPNFSINGTDNQSLTLQNDSLKISNGNAVFMPYIIKSDVCNNSTIGSFHYNKQLKLMEYCDGVKWNLMMPERQLDSLKCKTNIPTNLTSSNIEIYAGGTTFIQPDNTGNFNAISNQFTALNKENGNIVYINYLSTDTISYKGDVLLNAEETAISILLYTIPFAFEPANQDKFDEYKALIRILPETKSLTDAIQASINSRGYLELDDVAVQFKAAAGRVASELSTAKKKSLPSIPNNYFQGIKLRLDKATFDNMKNVWHCEFTVINEWGCYLGVVPAKKVNCLAYPVNDYNPLTYIVPPMNVSKFMGTFTSWTGLKSYFSDSQKLFFEEGFGFEDMTWDKAKLGSIKIDISQNQDVVMILGSKESQEVLLYNIFMMFATPILKNLPSPKMNNFTEYYTLQFIKKLTTDIPFMTMVWTEKDNGTAGYKKIGLQILDKFANFLVSENMKIFSDAAANPKLWENSELANKFLDNTGKQALFWKKAVEIAGDFTLNLIGISSFKSFYFDVNAEYPAVLPVLSTINVSDITLNSAKTGVVVSNDGGSPLTSCGICWSTSANPTLANNHSLNGTSVGSFVATISNLKNSTKYYVCAYATNTAGLTNYGNQISFTTGQSLTTPVITTTNASNIARTTAISGGNITIDGGSDVTERGVCWSTSPNPSVSNNIKISGSGIGSFTSLISGLTANTTYYVKAYAKNSAGISYGGEISFKSLVVDATAPVLTTNPISNINLTSATSGGNITSNGGATITARGVCWSTSTNPTIADNKTTDGIGTGSFTSSMTGFTNNTTYYVRAYASNGISTGYGDEISFTTGQNITTPTLTTNSITNITQTAATSGGNITSDGGSAVIQRGVCWSTNQNPTIIDNKTIDGSGTGVFVSNITGLLINTTYYVRSYATNNLGTSYGNELYFFTNDVLLFNPNLTYGTVSDSEGNIYKTIQIGTQTWMAENLKSTKYSNGNSITDYIMLNNDTNKLKIYGLYYSWSAAMNGSITAGDQGVCPTGWHIPTYFDDWQPLWDYLGGGSAMKEIGNLHWLINNTDATNSSGFTAVPSGYAQPSSQWDFGYKAYFCSSTKSGNNFFGFSISHTGSIDIPLMSQGVYMPVRCIKN